MKIANWKLFLNDLVLRTAGSFHDTHDLVPRFAASFHNTHDLALPMAGRFQRKVVILAM